MLFSYNWLKDYIIGKVPEPKKLAELLTFHSFEVEGLEKKGKDWVLDIDVLPNRAHDCFSHIGVARECAVLANLKLQMPGSEVKETQKLKAKDLVTVEVKKEKDCPRYSAKIITGVEVKSSPKWMQERLKALGLQPINNIVDITNYVMLETGQPLHAFDLDKLGKKILVRRAKKGEKLTALDDRTYQLAQDILVVTDGTKPVAIAGIKGGTPTGIDTKTKNIVIEAGNWNQKLIRHGSRKLKLKTDASLRFEQEIDPNLIDFAQERVCSLIQEVAGGKVVQGMVDFYPKKVRPKKIKLNLDYVEKLLGIKIPKQKVLKILKALGLQYYEVEPHNIEVEVPTRRLDVSIPEDLIEEIGRVAGLENIPSTFPQTTLAAPQRNDSLFWERTIKTLLKEAGFCEVLNSSFCGEKEKEIFDWPGNELVELENPMSSFNKYLRPSLIPNLLKDVKENLKNFEEIRIFEVGKVFKKEAKGVKEKEMLAGVLVRKGLGDEGFYELKGVVDSLMNKLGISDVWYDDYQPTPEDSGLNVWHPRKCAEIKIGGEEVGFLGEIHPGLSEKLGIKEQCFVFDLDFEILLKLVSEEHEYQPISSYPASLRDLAILVPQGTKVVEVLNRINEAGGKLVRDVDLFDVYSGEGVPEGKENFAFHIVYQAEDKTLTSQEVDKLHQRIVKALEEQPSWEVRK